MQARTALTVIAAASLITVGLPSAFAAHGLTGLDETGTTNARYDDEPNHPTDRNEIQPSSSETLDEVAGNGFNQRSSGQWDLVLDAWYLPGIPPYVNINSAVDPNVLLRDATEGTAVEAGGPYMYPGDQNHGAWWGWLNDRGSGGSFNELPDNPNAHQQGPDGNIDDGEDNHTADETFDGGNNDTGYDDTGPWDEFVWRGANPHLQRGEVTFVDNTNVGSEDPTIQPAPGDSLFGFVQPGAHASYFSQTTGKEDSDWQGPFGARLAGYGVISKGGSENRDDTPDFEYAFFQDTMWFGEHTIQYDHSLLMTTTVTLAVEPTDKGQGLARDVTDANATDTDVYSSFGPVGELYETHVWDPEGDDDGAADDVTDERGPKGEVREFTATTYPSTVDAVEEAFSQVVEPTQDERGLADDVLFGPQKHEPNHDEDVYPAATRGANPADYNGNLGVDRDGDGNTSYYEPNDQSWDGYVEREHTWADFRQTIKAYGSFGFHYGYNTKSPETMQEQNTAGPGKLSTFGYVGSWWDVTEDTWIGDVDDSGCATEDQPYCQGNSDNPNDYGHNPTAAGNLDIEPEWRGTCDASVEVTLTPLSGNTNETNAPAWGTTDPPVGIYVGDWIANQIFEADPSSVTDVTGDQHVATPVANVTLEDEGGRLSNHVQYGNVSIGMFGDSANCESGQWFIDDDVYLPTGSATYPIKVTSEVSLETNRIARGAATDIDLTKETVRDVDVINSWT